LVHPKAAELFMKVPNPGVPYVSVRAGSPIANILIRVTRMSCPVDKSLLEAAFGTRIRASISDVHNKRSPKERVSLE
jgi:hypothetical protein